MGDAQVSLFIKVGPYITCCYCTMANSYSRVRVPHEEETAAERRL